MAATRRMVGSADPVANGQIIFVYRHIGTNQVVYSLRQSMKSKHVLRQLPFVGRHSVPKALRKDLWTPFFTVTFPTAAQGLDAYQKLREMRKLREFCWKKDPNADAIREMTRLPVSRDLAEAKEAEVAAEAEAKTEAEADAGAETRTAEAEAEAGTETEAETKPDGSSSQQQPTPARAKAAKAARSSFFANLTPSQLSKRQFQFSEMLQEKVGHAINGVPAREILRKYLLDHKATAVADLAAVLILQKKTIPAQAVRAGQMSAAAEARLAKYESLGRELARTTPASRPAELTTEIEGLKARRASILAAAQADGGRDGATEARELKHAIAAKIAERFRIVRAHALFGPDGKRALTADERDVVAAGRFHVLAERVRAGGAALPPAGTARNYVSGGAGGRAVPVFSLDGVHVQWAELYDADFAAAWPAEVVHSEMSPYVRHTAPNPTVAPPPTFRDFLRAERVRVGADVSEDDVAAPTPAVGGDRAGAGAGSLIGKVKGLFGGKRGPAEAAL